MREKAKESLSKIRKMNPNAKRHVPAKRIDMDTWTRIPNQGLRSEFGIYVDQMVWLSKHADSRYARTVDSFWFESKKDAFLFSLKWAAKANQENQ